MLKKIIELSVNNKLIIALLVLGLIGYGAYQTTQLPIDAVPDITNNQVQVITTAPSFGANDIERLVTFPVEQANSNISGLKEIRSISRFGLSVVTIVFEDNIDIYWARQQVAERLQQLQSVIPQEIGKPELGPISTGLGEIYQYVVRPKKGYEHKFDITELRTIQDWIIRRQLLGVKGVAEVSSFGGKLKQYEVAINTDKLNAYGITVNDVFQAIENNNQNTGGAYIEKGPTALYIKTEGLINTIEDIENIAIPKDGNQIPLFIRDVADVKIGHATRYGALTYNDDGEVAGAVVMMLKGANSSQVIKDVKKRIEEIQKTLPEGVKIEPFLDRTKMVNNAIHTVEKNLLEGALIVVFVLVLFLGNLRAGLLVASVIPLSMLFAICMMNIFGVSGNLMSLGALDFGLIIDGAVIIVESIMHYLSTNKHYKKLIHVPNKEMNEIVVSSAGRMMNSAVFGQIIILIVYLPILTLQGIEGKMFKPMAQTVAFALLGAFLLSLTYIPMMSSILLKKKKNKPTLSDRIMSKIETIYLRFLLKFIRIPKLIFSIVVGLFLVAIFILSRLGGEFIPSLEEGDFAVETRILPGSNLNVMIERVSKASHILKSQFPEVIKVVGKIGTGEVPTDPMPMDAADMMVILKDKKEWTSAKTFPELADKMTKALDAVPGINVGFQYPIQMRFNELMTGARQEVVVKIFGENLDSLVAKANQLAKIIEKVEGTKDLYIEPISGLPQVIIQYNRATIAQYHLNISDVNKIVNTAFAGQSAGIVFEGEKRFDVVLRLSSSVRRNINDIKNLLISTPDGYQIPLSQIANVKIEQVSNQIQRENTHRRIVVGFNIKNRDVQSIVNELKDKVDKQIKFPTGYSISYGGTFENLVNAKKRLLIAVPIALALIFALLYLAFKSIKECLIIFTAIPLSIIGGVLFLAMRGMPFSISAGVGFIALFGVAVLNGIVLISEFNRLKNKGLQNKIRIIIEGGESRLRPVLMTAFVASLGFIPMALSKGAGAEVQRPLATVVIGGLLVATFLTLFILPLLYIIFEKINFRKKPMLKKITPIIILFLAINLNTNAQQTITLEQAIQIGLQNNPELISERLMSDYSHTFIKSAKEIPTTNFSYEFGQVNSVYFDNKLNVSQGFSFPKVYKNQEQYYVEEWKKSQLNVQQKELEFKKIISMLFYHYAYLAQKETLLKEANTLYNQFFEKASLRLKAGESNILEKVTASSQRTAIMFQLKQVEQAMNTLKLQLKYLLQTDQDFTLQIPNENEFVYSDIQSNTLLKILDQEKIIKAKQTQIEKSKLLPNLMIGYTLNSFRGTGPNDVTYNAIPQFHSGQIGIGISIFSKSQKAKIEAAKIAEKISDNEFKKVENSLTHQQAVLLNNYSIQKEIVSQYELNELKNYNIITETANLQFINGEINFLEYVTLINQAIAIKSNYIEALWDFNQTKIQLQYLTINQ